MSDTVELLSALASAVEPVLSSVAVAFEISPSETELPTSTAGLAAPLPESCKTMAMNTNAAEISTAIADIITGIFLLFKANTFPL